MCTLCKVVRPSRYHQSTKRHRTALHPAVKGRPERQRYVPRDWDAEGRRAAIIEEFGQVEDLIDPGTDTYVEFA